MIQRDHLFINSEFCFRKRGLIVINNKSGDVDEKVLKIGIRGETVIRGC